MKNLKWILLGIYLIVAGLMLLGVSFPLAGTVAGVLFILNR